MEKMENIENTKPSGPLTDDQKDKITKLLRQAKGDRRNMFRFAEACGVAASTFSRIDRGIIFRPLKKDLIENIVSNAADGVDREELRTELLIANNYIDDPNMTSRASAAGAGQVTRGQNTEGSASDKAESDEYEWEERFRLREHQERKIRILQKALILRGYSVSGFNGISFMPQEDVPQMELYTWYQPNYIMNFPSKGNKNELAYWSIFIDHHDPMDNKEKEQDNKDLYNINFKRIRQRQYSGPVMDYSYFFLLDAWNPKLFNKFKNSILFTDERIYSGLKDIIDKDHIMVNSCISFILINMEENCVKEEWFLPRKDGTTDTKSIFKEEEVRNLDAILLGDDPEDFDYEFRRQKNWYFGHKKNF